MGKCYIIFMNRLALTLSKIAYGISALFLSFIFFNTVYYTFTHDFNDLSLANLYETPDSRLRNLLLIILVVVISYLFAQLFFFKAKSEKEKSRRAFIFSVIVALFSLIPLFIWVTKSQIAPYWDQQMIYESALAIKGGDYSSLTGLYYHMYSQQLGLVFFESILLAFVDKYVFFQWLNCIFISLSVFLSARLTHELFGSTSAEVFAVLFNALFIPYVYYASFIYGDVFSLCASLFIGWLTVKWLKNSKILYLFLMLLTASIMVPVRQNTLIFTLTIAIVLIVSAIKNKKYIPLILAVAIIICPIFVNKGIRLYYENKTGDIYNNEIPSINWIVMGMQGDLEEGIGVGYYNGYNYSSWNINGCDTKAAADYSKGQLNSILKDFKNNPRYAYKFFRYKILEQWTEPTFDAIYMTVPSYETDNECISYMYDSTRIYKINSYMNYYLSIAYCFALIFALYLMIKDKDSYGLIIAVFFVGVFLFSIIWEAKGRYVFPGFAILLVFSAGGIAKTHEWISLIRSKIDGRFKKEHNSNS